ncbi:MAG: leucine-rich repeat protein [Bacteroidaceae bacterium]|nr:leucine-rich repeat protein [Bacteroidaceae bacterium]
MSVASEINRIKGNISDAYDEAEAKGATMPDTLNSDNLPECIASIPSGGPTPKQGKVPVYYLEFSNETGEYEKTYIGGYDTGETITLKQGSNVAAAHTGTRLANPDLVFDGWSCPLEIVDNTITIPDWVVDRCEVLIGATYHPADGLTHYIDLFGNDHNDTFSYNGLTAVYFRQRNDQLYLYNATGYFSHLRVMVIPNGITGFGNSNTLLSNSSIKTFILPYTFINFASNSSYKCQFINYVTPYGFSATNIHNVSNESYLVQYGQTGIPSSTINCAKLKYISLPNSVVSLSANSLQDTSVAKFVIPDSVTSIGNSAFSGNTVTQEYHFKSIEPPTLGTNVFASIPSDCKIYVPAESVTAYKEATNWATWANYIYAEPE